MCFCGSVLFLFEVMLVLFYQCTVTQLEKQNNWWKCIFVTDWILHQNSIHHAIKYVATVRCLIMAALLWCFCLVQWLFFNAIFIKCLRSWLGRIDNWRKIASAAMMTKFGVSRPNLKGGLWIYKCPCLHYIQCLKKVWVPYLSLFSISHPIIPSLICDRLNFQCTSFL